jgi:hypothetical protein
MKQTLVIISIFLLLIPLAGNAKTGKTDVTGTWTFTVDLGNNSGTVTFIFKQKGSDLTGTYNGALGVADLTGTLDGNKIHFSFNVQGEKIIYKGTVDSDEMKGTCDYAGYASGTFTAKRKAEKQA